MRKKSSFLYKSLRSFYYTCDIIRLKNEVTNVVQYRLNFSKIQCLTTNFAHILIKNYLITVLIIIFDTIFDTLPTFHYKIL